jgi:Mrp family chromosome partitioning ATPase
VQSFSDLMPKLKISDYDYIIFDLPPLSQTSGSLRLASQMERTILVVEAEETTKDKVKRARKLLTESHANLFAVLNKSHSYGPKSLDPDI